MDKDELRRIVERLLARALQARERGEMELAEQLTLRAMQYADEANGIADAAEPPPGASPPAQVVPQLQQQQQQRVKSEEDGGEE